MTDMPAAGELGRRHTADARTSTTKRAIDLAGATVLLGLLAVPMAVVALAILVTMGRPVLFVQARPGLDGRPFALVKFRTMREATDADGRPLPDAARVTRLGRLLRALSLDELPELVNVLRGEMSLVGPRPLLMDYLPRYSAEQARRHDVRPGMTGLAQVRGRKGLPWDRSLALDVEYVDRWSVALDLRILAITPWVMLAGALRTSHEDFVRQDFMGDHGAEATRAVTTDRRPGTGDSDDPARLPRFVPMTEEQLAEWRQLQGHRVVEHAGHYWQRVVRGFYQPVQLAMPIEPATATRPTVLAWGWRAALAPESAALGNGTIPLRLLADLDSYGEHALSGNRRRHLRRCRRDIELVWGDDLEVLVGDGYDVLTDAACRIGYEPPSRAAHERIVSTYVGRPGAHVLMGYFDGRLAGYIGGHACGDTASVDFIHVTTETLHTNISVCLMFDFLMAVQGSPGVRQVMNGLDRRENEGLGRFKASIGFDVVAVPARVVMPRPASGLIRRRQPWTHYRLTGQLPPIGPGSPDEVATREEAS